MPEAGPNETSGAIERKLATILCADVAGYSQMMGANEERTVRVFRGHREIFESLVKQNRGRIFNTAGDALLVEFVSAVEAVRCATDIQAALRTRNEHLAPEERMQFRIGINLGDVIVQGGDLLGDGVNVAARIQAATEPGGICISGSVHDQIQNKLSLDFKLLGEQTYKNIAKPVRTYTISEGAAVTAPPRRASPRLPAAIAAAAVLALAGAGYWGYRKYDAQRAEQARVESQLAAQLAAQKQATEQAQRAAEDAKREAQVQAQRQAAEEALRRAQDERARLEQDRKRLEAERRAAAAPAAPAAPAPAAGPSVPTALARYDGIYPGQLCNQFRDKAPNCWRVELLVRNGAIAGNWLSPTKKPSQASGKVAADGTVELNLSSWTRQEAPIAAVLVGRIADEAISASGQWRGANTVIGSWKRAQVAAAPAATMAPKGSAAHDGTYSGRLCNQVADKAPNCWPIDLVVRNGLAEASWRSRSGNTSRASGVIAASGALELRLSAWTPRGKPIEGVLVGRVAGQSITVSGHWADGAAVTGSWKRSP
jgi:class 3 adenylate cyclase